LLGQDDFMESLCDESYSLFVFDANGCSKVVNFSLTEPPSNTATSTSLDPSCFGSCDGQITVVTGVGTAPFSYLWDANANFQTAATATSLCAGTYSCTVTDANGCSITIAENISEPTILQLSFNNVNSTTCNGTCDGYVEGIPSGGVAPYSFSWSNGFTGSWNSGLCDRLLLVERSQMQMDVRFLIVY